MKAVNHDQGTAIRVMASNVLTMGALILFLSFKSEPLGLFLAPIGGIVIGKLTGKKLLNSFFSDRLAPVATIGIILWIAMVISQLEPIFLAGFWMLVGGGLTGLTLAFADRDVVFNREVDHIIPAITVTHPMRLNRLLSVILGWLIWSIPTVSIGWRGPLSILFICLGLGGLGNWELLIEPQTRQLKVSFSGVPGFEGFYLFNLDRFQRLLLVKLQEGGISWLQLTSPDEEITLPGVFLETSSNKGEIVEALNKSYPLVKQETTRDSLQMISILIPQATAIFTGLGCLILGGSLWWTIKIPESLSYNLTWILGGCCLISPILARTLFQLVVPGSMPYRSMKNYSSWEIGAALIIIILITQPDLTSLVLCTIVFMSWSVGIFFLQLVRNIPIRHQL